MDIELPSGEGTPDDESIFGGRIDLYEAYWLYVDGVRYIGPILERSDATEDDLGLSPLAQHYHHFYTKKEEHKEKCRDLPGNLPEYKEHFKEPRGEVRKIPQDELEELGIEWDRDDDPIWLPPEYELPPVWENDVQNMGDEGLRKLVAELQEDKRELQEERDELRRRLSEIRESLTHYLDSNSSTSSEETNRAEIASSKKNLQQLAEDLPKLQIRKQPDIVHEDKSVQKELENLNHLLKGSL